MAPDVRIFITFITIISAQADGCGVSSGFATKLHKGALYLPLERPLDLRCHCVCRRCQTPKVHCKLSTVVIRLAALKAASCCHVAHTTHTSIAAADTAAAHSCISSDLPDLPMLHQQVAPLTLAG